MENPDHLPEAERGKGSKIQNAALMQYFAWTVWNHIFLSQVKQVIIKWFLSSVLSAHKQTPFTKFPLWSRGHFFLWVWEGPLSHSYSIHSH